MGWLRWLAASGLVLMAGAAGGQEGPLSPQQAQALAELQQKILERFDLNKDGQLSDQEKLMAQEAMRRQGWPALGLPPGGFPGAQQFLKQFDRDGDGQLSPQEAMMAQAAYQRMRGNDKGGVRGGIRPSGAAGGIPPVAVPAPPSEGEKPGKVNPLVKRFDKDGDGKLNDDEKAAAQAELKKKKPNEKSKDEKSKGGKDAKDGKAKGKPGGR
jgi:hypothetical protein